MIAFPRGVTSRRERSIARDAKDIKKDLYQQLLLFQYKKKKTLCRENGSFYFFTAIISTKKKLLYIDNNYIGTK